MQVVFELLLDKARMCLNLHLDLVVHFVEILSLEKHSFAVHVLRDGQGQEEVQLGVLNGVLGGNIAQIMVLLLVIVLRLCLWIQVLLLGLLRLRLIDVELVGRGGRVGRVGSILLIVLLGQSHFGNHALLVGLLNGLSVCIL